jgi:hypothetical protein
MRRSVWVWLPLAFLLTCAGWALTSPVGSSPDDDYHLSSIWCAGGVRPGVCEEVPGDPAARAVPAAVVQAADCYRFDASIPASCAAALPAASVLVPTDRVNETAGLYPGGFYRVMGLLVGPDIESSVLWMRTLNAALAALLLAGILRLLPAGISSAAVLAIAVTFIPLGLSLVASTNPSSWTIVGIGAYWAFSLALLRRRSWRDRRGLLVSGGVVLAALMAIASRVDASAYLVLTTLIVVTLAGWRRSIHAPWRLALLGLLCALAAVSYLGRGTVVAGGTGMGSTDAGGGLLLTNLAYLPALFQGIVGGWNIGWNDTVMPPFVPVVGTLVVGALLYRGLRAPTRRTLVVAAMAAAALVAVPIAFLQANGLGVGEVVQPRYLLPLLTILVGVVSLGARPGVPMLLPRVPTVLIAVGLCVSAALAFWANAHRYFAGTTVGLFDPKVDPVWALTGAAPLLIALLSLVATTIYCVGSVLAGRILAHSSVR